jgi:hypothetical protein
MKYFMVILVAGILATGSILSGCGGSRTEIKTSPSGLSTGKELMDLDEAYKKGVISEKEYKAKKQEILKRK